MMPAIQFDSDRMSIHFDHFGPESYAMFLKAKQIPESDIAFEPADESYTISAPARFAGILGLERPVFGEDSTGIAPHLFDDQAAIVKLALYAKRFACWSDCGLGKTSIGLEWARKVMLRTGGRVLITTFPEVVPQWIDEAERFYGKVVKVHRIASRAEMREWCKGDGPGLGVVNYEKWNPEFLAGQVVAEAKHLAGFIADESSRLKTGGGKQKWAIIKSTKGIEYKLSLTATPAPNDIMEFASQASFLEKMRSEGEIIWTYFTRHPKTHRWTVRPHARQAFFEFMSTWSIYVRDPRKYGWRAGMAEVPQPKTMVHTIPITADQRSHLADLSADATGQLGLFDARDTNAIQRAKLSQVAKGFRYRKRVSKRGVEAKAYDKGSRVVQPVHSLKPGFIADLIRSEVADGLQVLVWTLFDAESDILAGLIPDVPFDLITGKTKEDARIEALHRFKDGSSRVLIGRASMLGFGMNFQHCGSMIFSGFNDSYESFYQAIRRAVRFGQLLSVRVHLPVIPELEGDMIENLFRKEAEHEAAISEMERNYILAMRRLKIGA